MLVPIIAVALVDHMSALASDYVVTAKVPAPIPAGTPVITAPQDGTTIISDTLTVTGTCPTSSLPIIIAIYDYETLVGSSQCSVDGTFSATISLPVGTHILKATVVTITDDMGNSSASITITRILSPSLPNTATANPTPVTDNAGLLSLFRIMMNQAFVVLDGGGNGTLRFSIIGGTAPYSVKVAWGDGQVNTYTVSNSEEQVLTHSYQPGQSYNLTITATDADGASTSMQAVAATYMTFGKLDYDAVSTTTPFVIGFIDKYDWQIYIVTLSSVVFLWYLEHGRHIAGHAISRIHRRRLR